MRIFADNFILRNINVIDVESGNINKTNVYIKDGFINQVTTSLDLSTGFQEINCENKYLLPGFIDVHVNILSTFNHSKTKTINPAQIQRNLSEAIHSGITEMRDVYAPFNIISDIKNKVDKYNNLGKKIYFSGSLSNETDDFFLSYRKSLSNRFNNNKIINNIRGNNIQDNHFHQNMNDEQIKNYVWNLVETGIDSIRIGNGFPKTVEDLSYPALLDNEKLKVFIDTAHRYNKKISINVSYLIDLKRVIELDINSIEGSITDKIIDDNTLERIKEKGVPVSPLLNVIKTMKEPDIIYRKVEEDNEEKFEKNVKNDILKQLEKLKKDKPLLDMLNICYENASENLKKIIKFDIPIVMGSGAGDAYSFYGEYFDELKLYNAHGLSLFKTIQSITTEAAKLIGVENEAASVKIGNYADLLVLTDNPLENIDNLKTIEYVFKNGKAYQPKEIYG